MDQNEFNKYYEKKRLEERHLELQAIAEASIIWAKAIIIAVPLIYGLAKGVTYLDLKQNRQVHTEYGAKARELNKLDYAKTSFEIVNYYTPKNDKFYKNSIQNHKNLDSLLYIVNNSPVKDSIQAILAKEYDERTMHQIANSDPQVQMVNFAEYLSRKLSRKNRK